MVRVFLKGGVWKNSEDEILKAAVQKYGKQQWARVASLLNRKTAKQAKARWQEWLDPAVRKTEWSRAEDEKLLHLAKLMPAQWKTIAPLVGRTATQCQERYETLLDQAATAAGGGGDGSSAAASSLRSTQLRPGQIDAHPETKPARPDPVDMDEDELEMLQEARARLANTVGKKAKRKQREKILAAAKRMADLQKRRELKQAGLVASNARKKRKRSKEIDLGAEIPFYKPAPAGLHDTSTEQARSQATLQQHLKLVDLKKVNESFYKSRDREAAQAQKREQARLRVLEKANQQYAAAAKQPPPESSEPQRRKMIGSLQLPAPAVSDTELQQLSKLQQQQQQAGSSVAAGSGGTGATAALLGDYSDRPLPTPMRTPASGSAASKNDLMQRASQLRQLERGQTPLLVSAGSAAAADDDDMPDDDDDRKPAAAAVSATPALVDRSGPAGRTPARDALGLNAGVVVVDDAASVGASTFATATTSLRELARQERRAAKKARLELEAALAALPAAVYEYELAAPPAVETVDEDEDMPDAAPRVQDRAQVEAAQQEARRQEALRLYEKRSSVLKRDDLPRPAVVPTDESVLAATWPQQDDSNTAAALELIRQEVLTLLQHDAHAYPVAVAASEDGGGKKKKKKSKKKRKQTSDAMEIDDNDDEPKVELPPPAPLEMIPEQDLENAKTLLQQEFDALMEDKIALVIRDEKASTREEAMAFLVQETMKARQSESLVYHDGTWHETTGTDDQHILASLQLEFSTLQEATQALSSKNTKTLSKLAVMNGGYAKRTARAKQDVLENFGAAQNARIEQAVYRQLEQHERRGAQNRLEQLQNDIQALQTSQAALQKRYGELLVEKRRRAAAAQKTV